MNSLEKTGYFLIGIGLIPIFLGVLIGFVNSAGALGIYIVGEYYLIFITVPSTVIGFLILLYVNMKAYCEIIYTPINEQDDSLRLLKFFQWLSLLLFLFVSLGYVVPFFENGISTTLLFFQSIGETYVDDTLLAFSFSLWVVISIKRYLSNSRYFINSDE